MNELTQTQLLERVTEANRPAPEALPGYKEPNPCHSPELYRCPSTSESHQ